MSADLTAFPRRLAEFKHFYHHRPRWCIALVLLLGAAVAGLMAGCTTMERVTPKSAADVLFLPLTAAEAAIMGLPEPTPAFRRALHHTEAQARVQAEQTDPVRRPPYQRGVRATEPEPEPAPHPPTPPRPRARKTEQRYVPYQGGPSSCRNADPPCSIR